MFTLQILLRMEDLLREEHSKPDLVLSDHFDYFAGTSTGAIIATGLAWGMPVGQLIDFYGKLGNVVFRPQTWYRWWKSKYSAAQISVALRRMFAEDEAGLVPATLGTDRLKALLLVVTRNASTGGVWPVTNNPGSKYNDRSRPNCNLDLPLWQLVRASTAAPSFFPPESLTLGDSRMIFMDGGVSPYVNPSFLAYQMATLPPFNLCWPASEAELHLVSVGTSRHRIRLAQPRTEDLHVFDYVGYTPKALIDSCSVAADLNCRTVGRCLFGAKIDSEIGDLVIARDEKDHGRAFTYVRYDRQFQEEELVHDGKPVVLGLDNLLSVPFLNEQGKRYASENVRLEHLL